MLSGLLGVVPHPLMQLKSLNVKFTTTDMGVETFDAMQQEQQQHDKKHCIVILWYKYTLL